MKQLTTYITEAFITKANLKKISNKKYLFVPMRVKDEKQSNDKWTSWNHRLECVLPYSVKVSDMDDLYDVVENDFIPNELVPDDEIVKHYTLRVVSYEPPHPKADMLKDLIQHYLEEIKKTGYWDEWNCKTVYFVEMVDKTDPELTTTIGYINATQEQLEGKK